ncbi:reverse transcriptase family protein [Maritalea mediterranea]|uniref:RNA-directed DNA polymerase n=1 Tax=Maritalea mediterranea TaxID=2909667 RepID=A0ABS9E313_9HYPH|nr:reverse transcriptase family protein [Maritalea mediterranea]MCF4097241.1 reverse transcriptase family protein [Maritalea mediterranea]
MDKRLFSHNLAVHLSLCPWSLDQISACLRRNLPKGAHKYTTEIANELHIGLPTIFTPSVSAIEIVLRRAIRLESTYQFCRKQGKWPALNLSSPTMCPTPAFEGLDIPQLPTTASVADWLSISERRLDYLADEQNRHEEHGEASINHYHYIFKNKNGGGIRVIEAPKENLKSIQRAILKNIIGIVPPHDAAFGFVKGRNCLKAANRHVGEKVVLCFDLKNFFPSIGAGRVFGLFRCLGYPDAVARVLTSLCTSLTPRRILERFPLEERSIYNKRHLPQGAPTSPALANQICFGLDKRLNALAKCLGAQYSRYADDLTFSGDKHIARPLQYFLPVIAQDEGFSLNRAKTRVMPRASRQTVTGVLVNEHLNIDRRSFDKLKAIIHACGKPGDRRLLDPSFRKSLMGKIDWVESVNPHRGQRLRQLLSKAVENHI